VTEALAIELEGGKVSALYDTPAKPRALFVFAHGVGAGMRHKSMEAFALGLPPRGIAALRYQFPYMEAGGKRPDPPKRAHAAVRAACARAQAFGVPLIAGGRSFGGRMTSQTQAETPLPGVVDLAFLGFPLHPSGKPGVERAAHLADVNLPMLFLQGTKDTLAELDLLKPMVAGLGKRATLELYEDADHSFHVPARTGRKDADIREAMLDAFAGWVDRTLAR
jgi:predicted alpha/beta-hydrolase family hydrolase